MTVTDPKTEGLPAINTASTKRDGQHFFLTAGIEMLTRDLYDGRAISPDAIKAALALVQRAKALEAALEMRFARQVSVIDDEQ